MQTATFRGLPSTITRSLLDVRVPPPAGAPVAVGDVVPELGGLAADVTYGCHEGRQGTKCHPGSDSPTKVTGVAEVVAAPPRGLELFASRTPQETFEGDRPAR